MSEDTKRLIIKGKVQGVGFRYALSNEANRIGVNGWVRNLSDGSVESVIQGPDDKLDKIIEWVKNSPGFASVDDVQIDEAGGSFREFEITY